MSIGMCLTFSFHWRWQWGNEEVCYEQKHKRKEWHFLVLKLKSTWCTIHGWMQYKVGSWDKRNDVKNWIEMKTLNIGNVFIVSEKWICRSANAHKHTVESIWQRRTMMTMLLSLPCKDLYMYWISFPLKHKTISYIAFELLHITKAPEKKFVFNRFSVQQRAFACCKQC